MSPRRDVPAAPPPTGLPPADPTPGWALATSLTAPVAMIGGWTLAAALQESFDPVRSTISELAAGSSAHPGVMTAGLLLTGLAHLGTASGLRAAAPAGRMLLALGGLGTAAVAMLPVDRFPVPHTVAATVGFCALAAWPAAAMRRRSRGRRAGGGEGAGVVPGALTPVVAGGATVVLAGLLGWFFVELRGLTPDDGALTGLAERAVAGAQSLWPLVVVVALRAGRSPAR